MGEHVFRWLYEENMELIIDNKTDNKTGRDEAMSNPKPGPSARPTSALMTVAKCLDLLQ